MALTAARTELNVSLVGEDETIRMLEDAKKRMGELEAKTRTLTGATQAQTQAAKAQEAATGGLNATLGRMGGAIAGPLEGIGKLKEGINKGIEIFGFLGMGVNAAISAFNFLTDAFDDSEEKAAVLEKQMARNKAESDRLREATDALTSSLNRMKVATGQSAAALAADRAMLADLRGDTVTANFERQVVATEQQKLKLSELRGEEKKRDEERQKAVTEIIASDERIRGIEYKKAELARQARRENNEAMQGFFREEHKAKAAVLRAEIAAQNALLAVEQSRRGLAVKARDSIDDANQGLREQIDINKQILEQQLINAGAPVVEQQKRAGGGGGRPVADELAQREDDWEKFSSQMSREIRERAEYARHLRQMSVDERERQKKLMGEPELFAEAERMRKRIADELAALPGDVTAKAFDPLRGELEKSAKSLDEFLASRVAVGDRSAVLLEEEDAIAAAYDKQREALDKVKASMGELGDARGKAIEEADKMREAIARALPAEVVGNFATGLEQLGQIQAPVFEAVQESLAGITAQMSKFKEGQTSLASALVGSASAIAGAVAKKVGGVKAEAGVRAAFEVAMGIATAFTNPAESVGHFAAATAFGLLAGGVVKPSGGGASGGQKAPAAPAAATREGTMGGMGGSITNVYNLQTGIVDGQSTAMAFRRAEMTARNTGMASAGGW